MAIKVCKLRDGGVEIIADVKETRNSDGKPIAYLLINPYRVEHYLDENDYFANEHDAEEDEYEEGTVDDDLERSGDPDEVGDSDLVHELDGTVSLDLGRMDTGIPDEPFQLDKIRLQFYPWCPLAKDNKIYIPMDYLVTAYDAHPDVEEKYTALIERMKQIIEEEELAAIDAEGEDDEAIDPEVMIDEDSDE